MVVENELKELERRNSTYRGDRSSLRSQLGHILIDYELATGATMCADAAPLKLKNQLK